MDCFANFPEVVSTVARGDTKLSVRLTCGLQVDLRAVPDPSFGAAWLYFTGAKAHNIALRPLAHARGLRLNEYGVHQGERRLAGETEESVYRALDLPFIEPELREDRGEIQAAREGRLPTLLRRTDLRGDLHVHTTDSDGHDSLEAMAAAARERGLAYLAITDHSHRLAVAHGLDAARIVCGSGSGELIALLVAAYAGAAWAAVAIAQGERRAWWGYGVALGLGPELCRLDLNGPAAQQLLVAKKFIAAATVWAAS